MGKNIHTSLLTKNNIEKLTEADYQQQNNYLAVVEAMARLTYESIYVIDYSRMGFEYVSDNPLFLCGYPAAEVLSMGYEFYFKNVPEEDLELLGTINEAGFDFYEKIDADERKQYSITYDFHLVNKEGNRTLINHKLTPLFLNSEKKMWKAMCIVSMSHHQQAGNARIYRYGSDEMWELDIKKRSWQKLEKPELTQREKDVLRLHAQGLTINQIAEKLFVVPDTVKYYRRQIFERLQVNNIVEALAYAVNSRII
ncbi:DNA-binding CsgD family transcriptional regulator [Filimonas zeae]|uniref:HTH luxR-type domain-containing protein n=1 Tax=Filimonas zeae TaxID=1737353 RepID=A0A917IRX6_9BACT|nr:helix-turn-helix transcriptional regulator [Filimonas zeae]MDR6338073.1 DNA-binding CsgD family transcriptional regulator [Filimonas zeae]GGH61578.1 hypothetical protein GCM10011379_10700 [Filimonas zeae]